MELTPASVTPPADAGAAPLASVAHLGRSAKMKTYKKLAIVGLVAWLLTLGLHIGTLPGGVPSIGTRDGYYWDEFIDGKRSLYLLGFMEVPKYQAGIPFVFTYSGGAMPASVDIAIDTNISLNEKSFVIDKATLVYDDGQSYDVVREDSPRSGTFSILERDGRKYCRARVAIPACIWKKQDYKIEVHGFIQDGDKSIKVREDVRVLYSENSFIYPGWFLLFLREL